MLLRRAGAILFVAWGLLHVAFGAMLLAETMAGDGEGAVQLVATARDADAPDESATALVAQHGWNLLMFGVAAAAIGATLNWKGRRDGFWINATLVTAADVGFVIFVLIPGHITLQDGLLGPLLWVAAVVASWMALKQGAGTNAAASASA